MLEIINQILKRIEGIQKKKRGAIYLTCSDSAFDIHTVSASILHGSRGYSGCYPRSRILVFFSFYVVGTGDTLNFSCPSIWKFQKN